MAGKIAFMQADELGFGQLGKTPAAVGIDFPMRPSGYSRCCILATYPLPDEFSDNLAKLFTVAKTEGIGFSEGLANCSVTRGRPLVGPDEDVLEEVDLGQLIDAEYGLRIGLPGHVGERQRRSPGSDRSLPR